MNPSSTSRGVVSGYGARAALRNLALALGLLLALAGAAAAEVRILAFGDSLTQGFGLPEEQGFVPRLEAWLRANGAPDVTVINAGVSGDTSAGGLARIDWALGDDVDGVIVALGGNDLLRGLDVGEMRRNLDGILTAIDARGLPVLLAGLPAPPNYGPDYRKAFKAAFRDLAETHGAFYVGSFLGGMGQGRSVREVMRLMQPDGIHPNAAGVAANVESIGPAVLELVAAARERG
jgi:acyl-CoA thioesterase I